MANKVFTVMLKVTYNEEDEQDIRDKVDNENAEGSVPEILTEEFISQAQSNLDFDGYDAKIEIVSVEE